MVVVFDVNVARISDERRKRARFRFHCDCAPRTNYDVISRAMTQRVGEKRRGIALTP